MNISTELQSVIELQMRNLHAAREQEVAAKAALEKHDADDPEISQLQKLLEDAQKRLDQRLAADEARKVLQTTATVAAERAKQLDAVFREFVGRAKIDNPELEAKDLPGVASFKIVEEAAIVDEEKALKVVFDLLRGVPGLLAINTDVLLNMHQNGLLREEWQRKPVNALNYAFGAMPQQSLEGWYVVNRSVKPGIDSDFKKALKKLENSQREDFNPASLIEVNLSKSA